MNGHTFFQNPRQQGKKLPPPLKKNQKNPANKMFIKLFSSVGSSLGCTEKGEEGEAVTGERMERMLRVNPLCQQRTLKPTANKRTVFVNIVREACSIIVFANTFRS